MKIKINSRQYKVKRLTELLVKTSNISEAKALEHARTLLDTELTEELKNAEDKLAKQLTEAS